MMESTATVKNQRKTGVAVDREGQEKDHFYSTPYEATDALFNHETFIGRLWEPACGMGHISRYLEGIGREVISTDLVERGYGQSGVDFLMEHKPLAPNIITNPPFKYTIAFVQNALRLTTGKVAMFLPVSYLAGKGRGKSIWRGTPIARFYIFTWRVMSEKAGKFESTGGGMMNFMWAVWDHKHVGPPTTHWLFKEEECPKSSPRSRKMKTPEPSGTLL